MQGGVSELLNSEIPCNNEFQRQLINLKSKRFSIQAFSKVWEWADLEASAESRLHECGRPARGRFRNCDHFKNYRSGCFRNSPQEFILAGQLGRKDAWSNFLTFQWANKIATAKFVDQAGGQMFLFTFKRPVRFTAEKNFSPVMSFILQFKKSSLRKLLNQRFSSS